MKIITTKILAVLSTCLLCYFVGFGQCASSSNIHTFMYDGTTYEVIKENKTWAEAAACAVERGGMLAEINDADEQNAIFSELTSNANIDNSKTNSPDGRGSYVWIGGNDLNVEGNWIWDGNDDKVGTQFWMGTVTGSAVGGLYNNWGDEPDDSGGQDALGLALSAWPLGQAGQWNDVDHTNTLYFVVEYSSATDIDVELGHAIKLYPNPAKDFLMIESENVALEEIMIFSPLGQQLTSVFAHNSSVIRIDLSDLSAGIYLIKMRSKDGKTITKKIVK